MWKLVCHFVFRPGHSFVGDKCATSDLSRSFVRTPTKSLQSSDWNMIEQPCLAIHTFIKWSHVFSAYRSFSALGYSPSPSSIFSDSQCVPPNWILMTLPIGGESQLPGIIRLLNWRSLSALGYSLWPSYIIADSQCVPLKWNLMTLSIGGGISASWDPRLAESLLLYSVIHFVHALLADLIVWMKY